MCSIAGRSSDWSDHALWWPEKRQWLTRSRSTLEQYDIQANCILHFVPMHRNIKLQLPDLQLIDMRVDFSSRVLAVVIRLCRELSK